MLWVSLVLVFIAAGYDLWADRQIPNWISILLVGWVVTASVYSGEAEWRSLLLGGSVGLILGLFLFRLGGIGGADVKLLVGIGASVGFEQIFSLLFYIGVAGGIAAFWTVLRGGREFAYLPAMALGFLIFLLVGG